MSKKWTRFKGKAMIAALVLLLMMATISPSWLATEKNIDVSSSTIFIDGDWIVSDTNVTENKEIILNGNLTITSTGSLTLNNVTLRINQSANRTCRINVTSGGEFYVDKNSNITSKNSYYYLFTVYGKLRLNNSEVSRTDVLSGSWGGIHVFSNDVYIGNSIIYDYNGAGITVEGKNLTVYNTTFYDGYRGILIEDGGNLTVEASTFRQLGDTGIDATGLAIPNGGTVRVNNSEFYDIVDWGVIAYWQVSASISNCTFVNVSERAVFGLAYATIWLNDSTFENNVPWGVYLRDHTTAYIRNISVNGSDTGVGMTLYSNITLADSNISNNAQIGVSVSQSNATIINCTINNNLYGLRIGGGYYNTSAINSTFAGNGIGVECGSANTTLLNSTVSGSTNADFSLSSEGRIFIKWFLHVEVQNQTDVPIPNANVRVYNKTNDLVFDGYTGSDGWRGWIIVMNRSMYRPGINPVEITYYDPHNITAEYNAVTNYTEETMDISKEVIIKLDVQLEYDPPVIEHTQITSARLGETIEISANVSDYSDVGNVILYYQNIGDTEYTAVNMSLISGNVQNGTWNATIPVQTETGIVHYFIRANDTSGNNATSPIIGDYAVQITGPPTVEIISPIGGEDWTGGSNHQIRFTASDTEDAPTILDVFLNYTSSAGNGTIAQIKGNESPYDWILPNIDATDVKINATVIDSDGNIAYGDSPEFTIDSTPPEIIATNPVNNSTGISIFQPIVIQFNERMNISSVLVNQTNGIDPGGWQWFWNEDKDTITGIHDAWLMGETIEITVQENYSDDSDTGNANNTAYVFSFTTETNPSPEIIHTNFSSPQELGDGIKINATITDDGEVMNSAVWWQDVDDNWHENYMDKNGNDWEYSIPGQMTEGKVSYQINATDDLGQKNTTMIYEFDIEDTTSPVIAHTPVENAVIGESINISCQVTDLGGTDVVYLYYKNETDTDFMQLEMNTGYWYEIPSYSIPITIEYYLQAFDIYGNDATTQTYSLEIIDPTVPDTAPPEVLLATPTGENIPISTDISIVFSEAVNQTSVEGAISVSPTLTSISYNWLDNQTLVIEADNLSYNTTYTISIDTGTEDLAGNTLANDYSWQFTTLDEPEIVQQPASDDWAWIGIIMFLISLIVLLVVSRGYEQ